MIPEFTPAQYVSLEAFIEMDTYAVNHLSLPIELMMENAGLQLARLVSWRYSTDKKILIGVGNGNNGGGGLVAARRLAGWGYEVHLHMPVAITKELPKRQLKRALAFGVSNEAIETPDIWIDAYLGFSQRLPLAEEFTAALVWANDSTSYRISLDLPMGISDGLTEQYFNAHQVMTLAAPKAILNALPDTVEIYVADLGIPRKAYEYLSIEMPPFTNGQLLKVNAV